MREFKILEFLTARGKKKAGLAERLRRPLVPSSSLRLEPLTLPLSIHFAGAATMRTRRCRRRPPVWLGGARFRRNM